MICSDIVTGAYQLLGRPSQGDMPYADLLVHAADVVRGRTIDLRLATRNHTLSFGSWFTPSATEQLAIGVLSHNYIPVKVEWRHTNAPESLPYTAQVTSYEQLSRLTQTAVNEVYVAFFNNNESMAFGEPLDYLAEKEFRVIYEDFDGYTGVITESTGLPDLFISLCKYECAIRALDQVENTEHWAEKRERLRTSLMPIFILENKRFEKWSTSLYGNKKVAKQGFRRNYRINGR